MARSSCRTERRKGTPIRRPGSQGRAPGARALPAPSPAVRRRPPASGRSGRAGCRFRRTSRCRSGSSPCRARNGRTPGSGVAESSRDSQSRSIADSPVAWPVPGVTAACSDAAVAIRLHTPLAKDAILAIQILPTNRPGFMAPCGSRAALTRSAMAQSARGSPQHATAPSTPSGTGTGSGFRHRRTPARRCLSICLGRISGGSSRPGHGHGQSRCPRVPARPIAPGRARQ